MNAEDKEAADLAIDQFDATYGAKYLKAVDKILKDREVLLHFDFPADHWVHLRTTNAIESTFATVRLRTRKTKGAGSRTAGLAMAYKLLAAAQARWRCVNTAQQDGDGTRLGTQVVRCWAFAAARIWMNLGWEGSFCCRRY